MPLFRLSEELIFPPPDLAEHGGLLAVGGDLSRERLLLAYSMGIFPWFSEGDPILWWSPDPRLVLFPHELKISRSLRQILKKQYFTVTMDSAFESVIRACSEIHGKGGGGTWITPGMISAYTGLFHAGYAHSVEAWQDGELAGGLYGVSLGSAFFGESMFTRQSNASKAAFVTLVQKLIQWRFTIIDCQIRTAHLERFNAREIPRRKFMRLLKVALQRPTMKGRWNTDDARIDLPHYFGNI